MSYNKDLNDTERVHLLRGYIGAILDATRNGSNIRGYFVWSFVDVYEFLFGYRWVYGLYHVNFEDKEEDTQVICTLVLQFPQGEGKRVLD
ncbi:Cyanidin 3-O-glucoside 5-O-glucosyltransferase (acyl-glucose) [Acorus calamus]|uniref:Cyanidin 3-O-glucoside 5-O-glucosyltransferase (Acyl-glucose) n=1 Tax=Acorus calamus TaxID=4465 RepID=A0AAV9D1B5_ACOCL|nr:Cyanidin 3-O-glucoside 5-O-glucosyltransferase (acyl-glucose) [Acorus calamus]